MNMKMSDFFELPVRSAQLEVYGANSNPEITFDDIENAAAHAINNHDRLTSENERLQEFVKMVMNGKTDDRDAAVVSLNIHSREASKLLAELEKGDE